MAKKGHNEILSAVSFLLLPFEQLQHVSPSKFPLYVFQYGIKCMRLASFCSIAIFTSCFLFCLYTPLKMPRALLLFIFIYCFFFVFAIFFPGFFLFFDLQYTFLPFLFCCACYTSKVENIFNSLSLLPSGDLVSFFYYTSIEGYITCRKSHHNEEPTDTLKDTKHRISIKHFLIQSLNNR